MSFELDNIDFYRLASNANLLALQADRLHSLKMMKPSETLKDEDLAMLKTLTQCTIDYATTILERETSYHE